VSKTANSWPDQVNPLDIVYCHFPDDGTLDPAPKPRPALVLNVDDRAIPQRVQVAYGTSRKTTGKYSGEFELTPRDGDVFGRSGLEVETKFDLGRTVWLPYDDRWFKPRPAARPQSTPKLGVLDVSRNAEVSRRFIAAATAAGLLRPNR
jgi:hypothetical protein